LQTLES